MDLLVNWASLAIVLMSSLVVVSLFVLRRRGGAEPVYRCTGYPLTPAIYLGASLGVAWASVRTFPVQSLYGVLIAAAGLPVYWLIKRGRFPNRPSGDS